MCLSFLFSAWNKPATNERIFIKFYVCGFFDSMLRRLKYNLNLIRIMCTLSEHLCRCMIISHWILLRVRNISDKSCRASQNIFHVQHRFPRKSWPLRDNVVKFGKARQSTNDNTTRYMRYMYAGHYSYGNTLVTCNNYRLSTAKTVTLRRLHGTS